MSKFFVYPLAFITFVFENLACTNVVAQEVPKPPKMVPAMIEFWEPEPRVVTPGQNNAAPSDAIVLFNGKDLSAWKARDSSGEARWPIKDGYFTVGKGDIFTIKEFGDFQLNLEWSAPDEIKGTSQGRGSSGVFYKIGMKYRYWTLTITALTLTGKLPAFTSSTVRWSMPQASQQNGIPMTLFTRPLGSKKMDRSFHQPV